MRTKVLGIVVGVAVLHVALLLVMVGTSGCAKDSVMGPRQVLPPVADNPAPMTATPFVAPTAPTAPTTINNTPAPAAPVTDVAALPNLDLGKLPKGPSKAKVSGPAAATYKVVSGDTLGGIAGRYGVKTADLASYNGLTLKSTIRVGQSIQIPPGGKLKAGAPAKKSTATTAKAAKGSSSAAVSTGATGPGGTYVVVKGDFPEKIAKKHKVSTKALLAANNLTKKSVLQIGQKLTIPGKDAVNTPAPVTPASGGTQTTPVTPAANVDDLNDVLNALPTTTVTPAPTPAGTTATPAPGTTTPAPAAVTPVTPPVAPANTNVELDPIMVERDQPLKDFALRYGVTEDVIRRYNATVIPADNILKQQTIIMLPQVAN